MNPEELAEFAEHHFDIDTSKGAKAFTALRRAIDREMLSLQGANDSASRTRYQTLMDARVAIPGSKVAVRGKGSAVSKRHSGSSEVERVQIAVAAEARATRARKTVARMNQHQSAAKTRASVDFTKGRTWPLAGLAAVGGAIWGTREVFSVQLPALSAPEWLVGSLLLFGGSACFLLVSAVAQSRDERILRGLYDPDTQARALQYIYRGPGSGHLDPRAEPNREGFFSQRAYSHALLSVVTGRAFRRASMLFPAPRYLSFGALSRLSTVDLDSALRDAADLALQRLILLGAVDTAMEFGQTLYRAEE